ncbi:hypothetical protein TNCV_627351 [Trichonephila clavipes]|nr:hypothetical protein TNCV_627351 [Trichonephila clavipes]
MPLAQDRVLRPTTGHNPNAGQNSALCHPATIHTSEARQNYATRTLDLPLKQDRFMPIVPCACPGVDQICATRPLDIPLSPDRVLQPGRWTCP